jgi:hypothetical protein
MPRDELLPTASTTLLGQYLLPHRMIKGFSSLWWLFWFMFSSCDQPKSLGAPKPCCRLCPRGGRRGPWCSHRPLRSGPVLLGREAARCRQDDQVSGHVHSSYIRTHTGSQWTEIIRLNAFNHICPDIFYHFTLVCSSVSQFWAVESALNKRLIFVNFTNQP